MSVVTICLLALLSPQDKPKRIVLPPTPPAQAPAQEPVGLTEFERFHRDATKLRRSVLLSSEAEDALLQRLRLDYQDPAALALQLAAKSDADFVHGLLRVVTRLATQREKAAEELLFLVQTRPFASATKEAVEALADLDPPRAKERLLTCLTSRYAGVRKAATDQLLARIDKSDLPRLLALAQEQDQDIQRKALFLLGALPHPPARERLIMAIGSPLPTVAATACQSLIAHGVDVVPDLAPMLQRPAIDRTFGYAAFAVTALEDQTGRELLPEAALPYLLREVRGNDPFLRTTAALALANMAFRSDDARGETFGDRDIVDGLLMVVAPRDYVPNISMLQKPAAKKLVQFTGQDFRGHSLVWRGWWDKARPGFVGMRLRVSVTPENAMDAVLTWTSAGVVQRFIGERVEPGAPRADVFEFILTGAEMAALVQRLESLGFMGKGLVASAGAADMLPVGRSLELELGSFRSRVAGPTEAVRSIDVLEEEVRVVADRERWQLYREPVREPDARAAWRAEREWLAAHADTSARNARLKDRIVAALPSLADARRELALGHLLALPDLGALLTEGDGLALVDLAARSELIDDRTFDLLEVALLAPGDRVWRRALDVVADRSERGGRQALPRVFALLGAEKVLAAVREGRPDLRVAAIHEVASLKDRRAVPDLLAAVGDPELEVCETAVYALGVLRVAEARETLLALQADPATAGTTRRVAWVALGRIGGEGVLPVLQAGAGFPELADQLAAAQAMGELDDLEAARFLALMFATRGYGPLGTQAVASLQRQGGLLARPALQRYLGGRDPQRHQEIVLLLAEFQDPSVVEHLIAMLDDVFEGPRVALLLSTITGVDLAGVNQRVPFMQEWWRTHKDLPQAVWFMESLGRDRIETTLRVADLAPKSGVAAVPELTRIMLSVRKPYLRVMAAALLRDTTDREFGRVSLQTPVAQLQAIADRYRYFADAENAEDKR
jgi:HEAT repeat protein